MPRIVIAAGGTAGHVVPALAIADELRARGAEVSFVGTRERVESELVPAAGYEIAYLNVAGLDRRRPDRAALALLRSGAGVAKAVRLLATLRPDAVLGAGGYVAGPVGLAAVLRRIPLVLSEADSRLGLSNRMLARYARRVCLAFPIEDRTGERYRVTGRPVPKEIAHADRSAARDRLGIDADASCLLVVGGSLGARSVNTCALEAFGAQLDGAARSAPSIVLHVSGRRDYPELVKRLDELGRPSHYRLFEWIDGSLSDLLAAADLVVARSGGSVFELAAAGAPSILVPYPHATGDHQATNARWLADAGAAVVLDDRLLDPSHLRRLVADLLGDRERLRSMSQAAHRMARPDAAEQVVLELLDAATSKRGAERPGPEPGRGGASPWHGRRLHFVGIGGAGMSGLALVARSLGADVTGCDRAESVYTQRLADAGIDFAIGHSADHVEPGSEVVISTAIPDDNPDLQRARELGVPIVHRGQLLAEACSLRNLIAVTGTHGKTTTAAMTAHCLRQCGLDPGFVIGADLSLTDGRAANAHWGTGRWLVAEADESDRSFLSLSPEIAVVTNVELDHHTTYPSLVELEEAFRAFLARLRPGGRAIFWNRPALCALRADGEATTYDTEDGPGGADLVARNVRQAGLETRFELVHEARPVCDVRLPVPGRHNVMNALAAIAACAAAGTDFEQAARSLQSFRPAARRFEPRGDGHGVHVFDDYAHHPTEVAATLDAARALDPQRLIAVFQPHLYSRTLALHREFGRELARADLVVVLDVYPARERQEGELAHVTGKLVADAAADYADGRPVWWLPTLDEAEGMLTRHLTEGDVVVTLGAGDIDRLAARLAANLNGA